jgi:hypothetical protein
MTDAELSVVKCRTMFITRRSSNLYRRSLNQTTNHTKPILIPLLYHTRGRTLKKCLVSKFCQIFPDLARVTSMHILSEHPPPHAKLMMKRRPEFLMCRPLPLPLLCPSSALPPPFLRPSSALPPPFLRPSSALPPPFLRLIGLYITTYKAFVL